PAGGDAPAAVAALREACLRHPGPVPVFVHVLLPEHEVVIRARSLSVDGGPEVVAALQERFGTDAVRLDHA
ncbi:MAG TPA: hypothetical protein VNO23_14490, partial [Candidatus Binatia bacterium]|nr:hypothetical protein [Candidatus Binatia bacterium]